MEHSDVIKFDEKGNPNDGQTPPPPPVQLPTDALPVTPPPPPPTTTTTKVANPNGPKSDGQTPQHVTPSNSAPPPPPPPTKVTNPKDQIAQGPDPITEDVIPVTPSKGSNEKEHSSDPPPPPPPPQGDPRKHRDERNSAPPPPPPRLGNQHGHRHEDKLDPPESEKRSKLSALQLSIQSVKNGEMQLQDLIAPLQALVESLQGDENFKNMVKAQTKVASDEASLGTLVLSLQGDDAFKDMVKAEVKDALSRNVAEGSDSDRMRVVRDKKAKAVVEESAFRPYITSSLDISSTVMTFLVGFLTLIALQPSRTTAEMWTIVGMIAIVLVSAILFLSTAWNWLGSLTPQVNNFTAKRDDLIKESTTVETQIRSARPNAGNSETPLAGSEDGSSEDSPNADLDTFLAEIRDGAHQTKDLLKTYKMYVKLLGAFAIVMSLGLILLSYVKRGDLGTASPSDILRGYEIFGRGVKSLGRGYSDH